MRGRGGMPDAGRINAQRLYCIAALLAGRAAVGSVESSATVDEAILSA
jgi:hypothetical protein